MKTPPFSSKARVEAGFYLRMLQQGELLTLPHSCPMPVIGSRCHELRIQDTGRTWRILYRLDADAVIIAEVFQKTTQTTPPNVIANCKRRLSLYDSLEEA